MGVITAAKWPFPHFNVPDNQAARRGRNVRPRRGCQTPNYDEMMKERPGRLPAGITRHRCRRSLAGEIIGAPAVIVG